MNKTYRRKILLCSYPVDGFYRYDNIFQILPPDKAAPRLAWAHHPLIIEYCFDTPEVRSYPLTGSDNLRGRIPHFITIAEAAHEKLQELLRLLCVVTNFRFFVYGADQAWFVPIDVEEEIAAPRSVVWGQEFYHYPGFEGEITEFSAPTCSSMNTEDPQSYYNRRGMGSRDPVDLPGSVDDTIFKYFQLDDEARESFVSSATLFSNGIDIWSKMASLSFAAFISSIETLTAYDHRDAKAGTCSTCGQRQYKVMCRFREFIRDYGSSDPSFKKIANRLYKRRSEILHEGSLFLGDLHMESWGSDDLTHFNEDMFRRAAIQTTRICLVNWLLKENPQANTGVPGGR